MSKKVNFLFLLVLTFIFTSCGPKRADVTLHVDEDVYIKTIIIAKTTSSITIDVFDEHKDLNLKKGDTVSYSIPKGYYDFYIYVDKNLSPTYDFPTNYHVLRPYFRLTCDTSNVDSCDIYFSDVYYGNGYSIKK